MKVQTLKTTHSFFFSDGDRKYITAFCKTKDTKY